MYESQPSTTTNLAGSLKRTYGPPPDGGRPPGSRRKSKKSEGELLRLALSRKEKG